MPINSTLDVVIQEDDLVVLGPPSTVDISLDIGAQGDPGSQIYTGSFDPNSITTTQFNTLYGSDPAANDIFLRTEIGEYYGTFYSYVNIPGGIQWEPVLEIVNVVDIFLNLDNGFILSASAGGTGVNNGLNTITFGGNIEFSGSYSGTFNLQDNTNITLPTSGSVAVWQDKLDAFSPTNSAELASVITDETGTGNLVFNNSPEFSTSIATSESTFNVFNTNATTINFAGEATNLTIGANEAGITNIRTATTNLTGDLIIGGGDLTVTESTFNLANTTATTVNFAGAATSLNVGSTSGTTTINNDLLVSASHLATVDALQLDTTPGVSASVGRFIWDDGDGTAHITLKGGNVDLSIGQEEVALCYNGSGSAMVDGQVVYIDGAQGQRPDIKLASSTLESSSSKTFGVVTEPIADGEEGFVATFGLVKGINTGDFSEGAALWLSASAGVFTDQMPQSPEHAVFIGYVIKSNSSSGQIFVNIQNGYEIEELHNVLITSASANDVLRYNAASSIWVNEDISTVVNSASAINIQNLNVTGNAEIAGNLTVSGSVSYLSTEQVLIEDNIITLNSGVSASPTLNAGIEVERGTELNTAIRWNETLDIWEFTNDGTNYNALGSGTGEGGFTNNFLMMGA